MASATLATLNHPLENPRERESVSPSSVRVDFHSAGMVLEPQEFDAIEDWNPNFQYELIRGVLVVSPRPSPQERDPNGQLEFLLRYHQFHHPQGHLLNKTLAEQPIRTGANRRIADRAIWIGFDRHVKTKRDVPTIVVEFVSPSKRDRRRDYEEKRNEYLAIGVREYWIFDRFDRKLTVFRQRPNDGQVRLEPEEFVVASSDVYRTELLPGFELQPQQVFMVLDTLGDDDEDENDN